MENIDDDKLRKVFAKNLNYWLEVRGKKQMDLVKGLELNSSTISSWTTGKRMPRIGHLQMIANILQIEKKDLIEEKVRRRNEYSLIKDLLNRLTEPELRNVIYYAEKISRSKYPP